MDFTVKKIQELPSNTYTPAIVRHLLYVAKSYLENADRLIYSYGSKTFLSGYDLFDLQHDGKGNIDCSTFILLVLAGIPYECIPYNTGSVKNIKPESLVDMHFSCFQNIPEHYISIAERIGIPEIACPKGLDLERQLPVVSVSPVYGKREPVFFARPKYISEYLKDI